MMTATRCTRIAVAALAAVVLSSMPALAGPWGPTGPADNFTYSNGQDINGCFGTPIVSGDTFYFLESNFQVNAANGTTDTKDDTVSVDLLANQNMQFSSMQVTAFGSYSLIGDGSQVNLNAGLTMHENAGLERTWSGPLMTEPAFPIAFGGAVPNSGAWNGSALIDVTYVFPLPSDNIHVSLSNMVLAIAGPAGTAELNVQYEDLAITFNLIPEPASLALLAVGAALLIRRRSW